MDNTKQESAELRNTKYRNLTTTEKIAKATAAPGNSERELKRLNKQLDKENKKEKETA